MAVINVTEAIVREQVKELFAKDKEHCTCELCYDDVVALACNDLPPKYISTPRGEAFEKLNNTRLQNTIDVSAAIHKAMLKVWAKPRHQ